MRRVVALLAGVVLSPILSGCDDNATYDPLADPEASAVADKGSGDEQTPSGSLIPVILAPSYSIDRKVDEDGCSLQSTEGSTSAWTLTLDQDGPNLNARLESAAGDKILLHGSVGSSNFTLGGTDRIEEGECTKTLEITVEGSGNESRIKGTLELATTYDDTCGVASGQSCTVNESFDSL